MTAVLAARQRINRETFPPGPDHEVDNIMTFTIGHNATPMHAAATAERLDMIDLMVESGINIDATGGYDDSSSMHLAAWNDRGAEQLDHFLVDAEASARGDNLQLKCVPMENYQRILARLRSAASQ
jgi:hypothetical protein